MASGIDVTDELKNVYNKFKMGSVDGKKLRYFTCKISDDKSRIEVDKMVEIQGEGNFKEEFKTFTNSLESNDCRYVIYDLPGVDTNGAKQNRIILISWIPEEAPVLKKMLYASSKDALKKVIFGFKCDYPVSDKSELSYELACERSGMK